MTKMIINKWKNDISDRSRWKSIRAWSHQHFIKYCKIVCDYSITQQVKDM